jgi:hypothetical protein
MSPFVRARDLALRGLLALALVLALAQASQPLHLHKSDTSGLYNEEHVWASLESVSGDAPLPAGPDALPFALAAAAPLLAAAGPTPAAPLRHSDPRAPPRA